MVERRKLTPEFIDQLVPPIRGERWIRDTEIRGFGVRLWGGRTSGKSFAIRVADKKGRTVRESIAPAHGYFLEIARKIASKRIRELKGMGLLRERAKEAWALKLKELSLDELAKLAIRKQKENGRTSQYIDDNWSRFNKYVPVRLKQKRAVIITADEFFSVLTSMEKRGVQAHNLYSFMRYMLNLAWRMCPDFREVAVEFKDKKLEASKVKEPDESIHDLKKEDFDRLFRILKNEKTEVQKAEFIHLLFLLSPQIAPDRFLKAKVDEIFIVTRNVPIGPIEMFSSKTRKRAFVYLKPAFKRKKCYGHRLEDKGVELLKNIIRRNRETFPNSPFLFPSKNSPKSGHMTNFIGYWHKVRALAGLPNVPIKHLSGRYHWCSWGWN